MERRFKGGKDKNIKGAYKSSKTFHANNLSNVSDNGICADESSG